MNETQYNKLQPVDLHGGAGSEGPMDRETRYKGSKLIQNSDKEE